MASSEASSAASSKEVKNRERLIYVMFLCDEWKSSKGGLSTFNREFAINLAQTTTGSMKIHCYVSKSDDQDKEDAKQHNVKLITAQSVPVSADPFESLKFPPTELPNPHLIIGHGRKFGGPAYFLVQATKCKWIQFVHVYCEDLGKYKKAMAATDTIEENEKKHKIEVDLCKAADAVVAVGSRLQQKYSRSLPDVKVEIITPGIFENFSSESQFAMHRSVVKNFNVFLFGRATFEDLSLKGYDIVANAIGSLGKRFELTFVGSSPGEHQKVEQWFLDNTRISRSHLIIRGYCSDPEELKMMFYQSDLVALPSRTEGFGLVALEAISAGIPILVSGESGIAEALREVEGGNAVIVELDEDADEWARRISEMAEESSEEREAKARRLRENYRKVYSWRAECERFKGTIEKVVKSANGGELNIKVDVKDFKPEEQNTSMQTGILLTTESVRGQKVQQPRTSTTSATFGSVCYPQSEHLAALKEQIFLSIVQNYLQTTPPQSTEEHNMFKEYAKEMRFIITGTSVGSLVITVKCESQLILEGLWIDYLSGHLGEVVQNSFVTEKILKKLNLAMLRLETTMDIEEYNACEVYFERVALRDVLSAHSYFKSTEDEAQLERWKQNTEVVESEKVKSSLPILEMSTTGHNKEGEEPQETMKDQKLNIKVDVEHVKLADHDTCRTASVSTMEPAECQKASIASGARRKRRSDTELEDVQPLEKKVLCLIAMNYLHTTPPESRDECNEFQEYLLDMKVHITCVSVGISLVTTVKCDSLKSLEELWEDYSCGLLGKMVRDCFVTEKILKELNLAELRLKTTMDIEEYKACKLYFEKNALRGTSLSAKLSTAGHGKELEGKMKTLKLQEEKKLEGRLKTFTLQEEKRTSLSTKLFTAGHGKELEGRLKTMTHQEEKRILPLSIAELEELLMKLSSMKVLSTAGHEKELEGRLKTFKLQEEKRILPPSEEELGELLMKLQSIKGTSLSTKLSCTVGHGKELEGRLKTMTHQEEKPWSLGTWPVPEFSASDPEEELAKLRLKPQGMEVTSPSAVYFTTGHEKEKILRHETMKLQKKKGSSPSVVFPPAGQKKELEGRQKTIKIQGEKGSLPSSPLSTTDLEEKLEEVCLKLMILRKKGSLAVPESSTSHLVKKLAELGMELIRLRMEGTLPPPELFTADLEEELQELGELGVKLYTQRYKVFLSMETFQGDVRELLRQLQEKRTEALENTMYPTIISGLGMFDVSLPEELQSYVSYLFNESAKLGLRKRAFHSQLHLLDVIQAGRFKATHSLSSVEELRKAMDKYELKAFLSIHIREGAWQVALLFMDELPSYKLPRDWFVNVPYLWEEEEEMIGSSLYSSTSGILKAWSTEYDPDLVTLCKAITDMNWKVTGLILCRSRISEEGLKNLSTALTHGELYSLALCNSDLQSRGLKHLCEALISGDCNLTSLNVSKNWLGDENIMHLFTVLTSSNCTLTRLNVRSNIAGDRAVKDLARALTNKNCALASLDISWNDIGDEGIKYLCKALTDPNCKLRSLNLRENRKVTYVGKQCLSEAITGTDWEVRRGMTLSRSIKSEA